MAKTVDEIFAKDFKQMMRTRRGYYPNFDVREILPQAHNMEEALFLENNGITFYQEKFDAVYIDNIKEDYYNKLNRKEGILLKRLDLVRRKFDYNGNIIYEVTIKDPKTGKVKQKNISKAKSIHSLILPDSVVQLIEYNKIQENKAIKGKIISYIKDNMKTYKTLIGIIKKDVETIKKTKLKESRIKGLNIIENYLNNFGKSTFTEYDLLTLSQYIQMYNDTIEKEFKEECSSYDSVRESTEIVDCPSDSVAVAMSVNINVPLNFKPKDKNLSFEFIDTIERKRGMQTVTMFVYIIPKCYVFKMNQTALVLSLSKLRSRFYTGYELALVNGYYVYIYTAPYKPKANFEENNLNYLNRNDSLILMTKTILEYEKEQKFLINYFISKGYMFNPNQCQLSSPVGEVMNLAYREMIGVGQYYEKYNPEKPLSETQLSMEDFNGEWEQEDFLKDE